MSYVIQATLSNAKHPENGVATVPFPLSGDEYDHSITAILEPIGIGSVVTQDCFVEEIDSSYEILQFLKGQMVNVDELDYLTKRLDSFDAYEVEQFQAVCHVFGLQDIKDLINMTFCCQETTIISDFSKLEEAGKQHYLTIHGGSAPADELAEVDGKTLAQRLIQSGEGKPTPYGLFFRNGMRMKEPYQGYGFPTFLWDNAQAEVALKTLNGYVARVFLPITEFALERFQKRERIANLTDCKRNLWLFHGPGKSVELQGDMAEFRQWNELCQRLNAMSQTQQQKFSAAAEVTGAEDFNQLQLLATSLEDSDLIPGVKDAESYGRYMIQESGKYDYDESLDCYYNYEAFGEFLLTHEVGRFTSKGYLKCEVGSAFLDFLPKPAQSRFKATVNSPCRWEKCENGEDNRTDKGISPKCFPRRLARGGYLLSHCQQGKAVRSAAHS